MLNNELKELLSSRVLLTVREMGWATRTVLADFRLVSRDFGLVPRVSHVVSVGYLYYRGEFVLFARTLQCFRDRHQLLVRHVFVSARCNACEISDKLRNVDVFVSAPVNPDPTRATIEVALFG